MTLIERLLPYDEEEHEDFTQRVLEVESKGFRLHDVEFVWKNSDNVPGFPSQIALVQFRKVNEG